MSIALSFPDQTYTSSNKPSVSTLKTDLSTIETDHNTLDSTAIKTTTSNVKSTSFVLDEDTMSSNSDIKLPTQQSVKAYVAAVELAILQALYPVGAIFISGSATMPTKISDLGTWVRIEGKMIVGASDSDADFDNGDTGGSKTADLSHAHTGPSHTHSISHTHVVVRLAETATGAGLDNGSDFKGITESQSTSTSGADGTGATGSSGSSTQDIMNPFKAKYMWERTV